jgi:hypothetical protein
MNLVRADAFLARREQMNCQPPLHERHMRGFENSADGKRMYKMLQAEFL